MQPLVFDPLLKRIRWGGQRLGSVLHKSIGPEADYAESWEIADHGADQSIVSGGEFAGLSLAQLVQQQNVPLLGRHAGRDQFPLLVKFLDATDVLSVQVHPDDRLAKEYDPTENGKTEAWVILDADADSKLFVGLKTGVTATDLRAALDDGTVEQVLHRLSVQPGDCVFVPAGTVHAISSGVLLAEIQQSSDLTYRLYDWGRMGADGQPREVHIEAALRCINFERGPVNPVCPVVFEGDHRHEELVRCPHFILQRHSGSKSFSMPHDDAFHVLMVLAGNGSLQTDHESLDLPLGKTVLLPADRTDIEIAPADDLVLLDAFLP